MRKAIRTAAFGFVTTILATAVQAYTITAYDDFQAQTQILKASANIIVSAKALTILNNTLTNISGISTAIVTTTQQPGSTKLTSLDMTLPLLAVSYDGQSGQILSERLGGTLEFSVPQQKASSNGGSLILSDLRINLVHKQLIANVDGANGVGTQTDVAVWNLEGNTSLSAFNAQTPPPRGMSCGYISDGTYHCIDNLVTQYLDMSKVPLSGVSLSFTAQGRDIWQQSLGYLALSSLAMSSVPTFGTLTTSVPEASTWSMMALGLIGIGAATARRRAA